VATFVTSFNASDVASYRIVGTKGALHADPAYEYAEGLEYSLTLDGKTTRKAIAKRDQFAPELLHFSDCVLKNREPEPSGEEGLRDVRIVQALYESARSGKPISIRGSSRVSTRNHAASTATVSQGSSRKASRSWKKISMTRRWMPA